MQIKVLLVEDDIEEAELLIEQLDAEAPGKYQIHTVENAPKGDLLNRLEDYDVVIVDHMLQASDSHGTGVDFIRKLRESQSYVPCILVTSTPRVAIDSDMNALINQQRIFFVDKADLTSLNLNQLIDEAVGDEFPILHLEDDADDAVILKSFLEQHLPHRFDITLVKSLQEAEIAYRKKNYQAYICDLRLNPGDGTDFMLELLESERDPVIMVLSGVETMEIDERLIPYIGHKQLSFMPKKSLSTSGIANLVARQQALRKN